MDKLPTKAMVSLLIIAILTSCSTYHYERLNSNEFQDSLGVGMYVKIETYDGRKLEFQIRTLTSSMVSGGEHNVYYSEILSLETVSLKSEYEKKQDDLSMIVLLTVILGTAVAIGIGMAYPPSGR